MEGFSLEKLGGRLKQVRTQLGFGEKNMLRAFCREYKHNPSVWGKLEKGEKSTLYVQTVVAICEQFDLAPTWLLLGKGQQKLSARELKPHPLSGGTIDAALRKKISSPEPRGKSGSKA